MTTSATVSSSVNCTSPTEARMVSVRSEMTLTLMADGIEACSTGSIALIRSTVSMTLAPGWRWIARMMARCLLYQPASRLFSGAVDGLADVADPHRRAVAVGDDQDCRRPRA